MGIGRILAEAVSLYGQMVSKHRGKGYPFSFALRLSCIHMDTSVLYPVFPAAGKRLEGKLRSGA